MELNKLTITQAHNGLVKKDFSALELTKAFLDEIKEKNKDINAFLTINEDSAFFQAKTIDDLISQGREIPTLAGIPLGIKDNILIGGVRCGAASKILENYTAPYDATVIKKLKSQGAVFLGKTNLDEFAMGSSGESSFFGPTLNPSAKDRVSGGSSSGSAAAVRADFCCAALGSDTGGSIRLPASFCGVVGLKPTYGAVSRYGLIAMASSLDQIGPITKTAKDAKIVFEAIRGRDEMDSTSEETSFPGILPKEMKDIKIGVPKEYLSLSGKDQLEGMDSEVEEAIKEVLKKFEEMGAEIQEVSLSHTEYALAVYYIIMSCEVSSNMARYDGIKYGFYSKTAANLMDVYLKSREEGLGKEVKRRIMLGTYALSAGYYDAYYLKAQKIRAKIKEDFHRAFLKVDVLLTPTSSTRAFLIGEKTFDPLSMYLSDIFMVAVNLAGLPAISVPCGSAGMATGGNGGAAEKNLPIGFQMIGKPFEEKTILELGRIYQETN